MKKFQQLACKLLWVEMLRSVCERFPSVGCSSDTAVVAQCKLFGTWLEV